METETLSSYNQSQDKHILDDMNIPNHDDDTNSLHSNGIKEVDSEVFTEPVSSSDRGDNEENCDETVSSSENKVVSEDNLEENDNAFSKSINSPNVSSTNYEEEEEKNSLSGQEDSSVTGEAKGDSPSPESEEDCSVIEERDPLGEVSHNDDAQEVSHNVDEREVSHNVDEWEVSHNDEREVFHNVDEREVSHNDDEQVSQNDEREVSHNDDAQEVSHNDNDLWEASPNNKDIQEASHNDESCKSEKKDSYDKTEGSVDTTSNFDENKEKESEGVDTCTVEKNSEIENVAEEKEESSDSNKTEKKKSVEENKDEVGKSGQNAGVKDFPLLKETLTKRKDDENEEKEAEGENGPDEIEMDDDFDPSLLCPDIAMEVDEAPVITTTDNVPADGSKSPLLYEPVFSTYVDEMTGAEVTFNLTPEEHQMRQDTYGENNPVQFTKIHCTACNVHLGSALDGQSNRFVHPLLKVLICKDCYHFYTSGEFEKDEDGSELYCRWCGQGGQVMCCSACEMVFCKKCVRINYGRKKLIEIRDSDDWLCFRCNPLQLTHLRVHCAEFMEYVRREISRAATLENATSFMTTDYAQCCVAQKKKSTEPPSGEPKKRRKKFHDPDYDPAADIPPVTAPSEVLGSTSQPVPILPKPPVPNTNTVVIKQVAQPSNQPGVFRVGNTTFKPRASFSPRPVMQVSQPGPTGIRPRASNPGYIKIMPSGIRAASSIARHPAPTFVSSSIRPQGFQQRPIRPMGNVNPTMKHEWFEKTVRAAARVNSNLSYTLTQLNRAQATASSVEALAVVHNKLQEILSTSINSLIQIRKNLRTEFIAGIKNIRFPPKPQQQPPPRPAPSTSAQDDDVIFISPPTSPVPPAVDSNSLPPSVTLTNSSSIVKRNIVPIVPTTSLQPIPSTSTATSSYSDGDKPKVFLRVKSLSALQNVPSECITIPDDPPPPLPSVTFTKPIEVDTVADNEPEIKREEPNSEEMKETDVVNDTEQQNETKVNGEKTDENPNELIDVDMEKSESSDIRAEEDSSASSLEYQPSSSKLNLFNVTVYLERSEKIDSLVKNTYGLVNGDVSE